MLAALQVAENLATCRTGARFLDLVEEKRSARGELFWLSTDNGGVCSGGANDGEPCPKDAVCPDACTGGSNDGLACTGPEDCPGTCAGGTNDGNPCTDTAECPGGTCDNVGTCDDLGNCMYTSPVVRGRIVYFIDGTMTAVQLPEKAAEQVECKELWSGELAGGFFASPLVHGGRLYTVDKAGRYYVIDSSSGKVILKRKLDFPRAAGGDGSSVYPSPCLAGKRLFIANDAGRTVVLEPGDQGTAVGSGSLPGGSGGTPTFSGRRMFIRGRKLLYCLAAP